MIFVQTLYSQNKHLLNWLLLLFLGLVWGMSFMGIDLALESFQPITIASLRILFAALILYFVTKFYGLKLPFPNKKNGNKVFIHSIGMALFSNVLPFTLFCWAQKDVSSSFAGITTALVPLIVLPLTYIYIPNSEITFRKVFGFILGFFGVFILIGPSNIIFEKNLSMIFAQLLCILACFCYATGAIITKLTPEINPISLSACTLIIGSVIIIPIALFFEGLPNNITLISVFGVMFLGVFSTATATLILVFLIKQAGPPFLSMVNYQIPIWSIFFGYFLLNEIIPNSFIFGLLFIFSGLAISEFKKYS